MTEWINIIIPLLTTFLGAVLGYIFTRHASKQKTAEAEAKEKLAAKTLQKQDRLAFYQLMAVNLSASHDAFIEQCRIRNRILRLLGHDPRTFDWEELENTLADAFKNLNDEQRTLFDFIRGITENTLFRRNGAMLQLLGNKNNAKYFHELPEFEALQGHLELWSSKFESILKKHEDYCLVYVGVKEKKPFPPSIDEKVSQEIRKMEEVT